jgi:catechol 2,3-dioxygenase-like lactoylglutathione lyase family enzyme
MISGAHGLLYCDNPEADRAFFRDVLGFGAVDAGGGWLIFAAKLRERSGWTSSRQPLTAWTN